MKIKFEKVLGSKLDGRGGQLFFVVYKVGDTLSPAYNFVSFYVRADDGLRDCWGEFGLDSIEYRRFFEAIMSNATLPVFDVSFEYLKKRVKDGIDYKKQHNLFLPAEFKKCAHLLEYEAVDDLQWKNPPFFSKTINDYSIDLVTAKLFSEMLELGWGFNDEDMDYELPIISKIKYDPLLIFIKNKTSRDLLDMKMKKQADALSLVLKRFIKKIVDNAKVVEWEKRTAEEAYFCFNIGEKKTAKLLHIISLSLKIVPSEIEVVSHPFLQMLMLISIAASLKRHGYMYACGYNKIRI